MQHRLESKLKSVRLIIFFSLVLMSAFLLLAVRCFQLQFLRAEHYRGLSRQQQQKLISLTGQRGAIVDCRGRVLAASNKTQVVFAEPRVIKDAKAVSRQLQPILDMGAHEICRIITESKNPGFARIKVGVEASRCRAAARIYGVGVQSLWQRSYPTGTLVAQPVGFTSSDECGLGGIELAYDKQLRGSAGQQVFLADVFRRPICLERQAPRLRDGSGLILTLDAAIQQFVLTELRRQYELFQAESAVGIVAEPDTGAILAMVSLPGFDPERTGQAETNTLRNRVVADSFEPGSLLKPISAAIAIDEGVVGQQEKIFCEYGDYHGRGFGRIGEYGSHRFGYLTVREILIHSSNIGMAKIGQRLGRNRLYKGLKLFGFGRKTGIDLPGEVVGLLRPAKQWTGYSVTRIPFGQEISVTAIQLVRAFCILANGGRSVRPYLVQAMVDSDGQIRKLRKPVPPVGFVVKPEVARWVVSKALTGVVNEGTGKRAQLKKWQVFGKTGTANMALSDGRGYSEDDYVASFVAGAPAEKPRVVVLVSVRRPNRKLGKGYTGSAVAAPVAGRILEKTLNYLERCGQ